jgi:hypothetical protein
MSDKRKLSIVFKSARGCQGMVLQLVFDPLAYVQIQRSA